MNERQQITSDIDFIRYLKKHGGESLKKCYQCASCTVSCKLSPKEYAFPRKEMLYASWGLKDKLMNDADIWLCHACMDCSYLCPRHSRPADIMAAIRSYTYINFAYPRFMGKAFSSPKYLVPLLGFALFVVFIMILSTNIIFHNSDLNFFEVRDGKLTMNEYQQEGIKISAEEFSFYNGIIKYKEYTNRSGKLSNTDFINKYGILKYEDLINKLVIEFLFIPGNILIFFLAFMGFSKYWKHLTANNQYQKVLPFYKAIWLVLIDSIAHKNFDKCDNNTNHYYGHIYALYGFIGTFIATALVVVGEIYHYGRIFSSELMMAVSFYLPYPLNILHPVKLLGICSGSFLIVGLLLFIIRRLKIAKSEGVNTYNDWLFLIILISVAITGMLNVFFRLSGIIWLAYLDYILHLTFVFFLLWYMPWSKFAHIFYRLLGLTFLRMHGRSNKPEIFNILI